MKKYIFAIALSSFYISQASPGSYAFTTLSEIVKSEEKNDFQAKKKIAVKQKTKEDLAFEKQLSETYPEIENFDVEKMVSAKKKNSGEEINTMEDMELCSNEMQIMYERNALGECEKIILKNGCEIEDYFKRTNSLKDIEVCIPGT